MSNQNPFTGKTLHIVGFAPKPGVSARRMREQVVKRFAELAGRLSIIEFFMSGKNNSPEGLEKGFTYWFILVFRNKKDRNIFLKDPQHHAFSASIAKYIEKPAGVLVADFAARGSLDVKQLVTEKETMNANKTVRNTDGLTALHEAAAHGETQLVEQLLSEGADVLALDSTVGTTPLHKAVYSGNAETVKALLKAGALVNMQSWSNGDTPLHDALYFNHGEDLSVIKALLEGGASLAIKNRAGLAPLDSAKLLKFDQAAAYFQQIASERQSAGSKQLMEAVKANQTETVNQLLQQTSSTTLKESDEQGFTPLLWASREGFTGIVALLLEHGADPNQLDEWMGATSGHKAAFWGRAEVMKLLVARGLDLDARGHYNGYTALHDAVSRNHLDVAQVLVAAGARRDIAGHDGLTPLAIAKANGNTALVDLLQANRK